MWNTNFLSNKQKNVLCTEIIDLCREFQIQVNTTRKKFHIPNNILRLKLLNFYKFSHGKFSDKKIKEIKHLNTLIALCPLWNSSNGWVPVHPLQNKLFVLPHFPGACSAFPFKIIFPAINSAGFCFFCFWQLFGVHFFDSFGFPGLHFPHPALQFLIF